MAKAVNLLSGRTSEKKAVRERIRGHFECILVDEYQDTSPLQDRLIELLKKKDNLFIVGDVQQSIYGFRSADPEMFMRRTREKGPLTKHIRLDDNYRSRKDILGFINGFFQEFADVLLFRPLTAKKAFLPAKTPAVQWLCVPRDKSEPIDTDGARVIEARSIAGAIREVIKEGFRYGDIAVLFRSSKKSYLYEQELINASIPFSAARGGGFYSKPEILDLINFLRLIEDPAKDIALAAVLRSPLVGLSDDGLYWMARFAKGEDSGTPLAFALDRPRKIKGLSAPDLEKLEKFGAFLDDLRKQKERLGLSEMIERIINETVYDAKVLVREEGNQRLANSLKLIHIAHTLEDKNIVGIRDFVRYAERLAENEIEEEEARIADDAENTVTLSTIHAAKGLEFPVVIVADLGRGMKSSQRNVMLCLPGFGLGLKHVCPWGKDPLKDTSYSEIETILKEKEEKEEAQLLYVAMTRAKERLILSGSLPVNEGPSWMDRIARAISWESGSALAECNFNNIPIKVLNVARGPVESPAEPQIKEAPAIFSDKQAFIDLKKRLKPVVKAYEPSEDRTVTDLLIAAKPAAPVIIIEKDLEAPEDGMPRNEYGTLYHRVMEYTMTLARRKVISLSDIPLSVIRPLSQAQQKELKESVVKFWRGPWGKLAWGAKKRYSELPFIFRTPRGILKGQIDLILQTQSGDWLILDYKTNQITASQKKVVAREYETQIRIYAFIFMKLYGEAPIKGVLYFTAIDDVVEFQYSSKGLDSYEPELNTLFSKAIPIC
ncbi:MAG: hypothetical protein COT00_04450 [Candidatus Omnitrophica bacterium CG07_land_8_20_14_0_80_50_8]|nr:MAG: hypothetical protein COT00_04450 [Candidatus Omnitrophica bacterium CG07_land_8_20_14_0_80_50_8]